MDVHVIAPQPKKHKAFSQIFVVFSKKRLRQQKTPQGGEIPRPAVFYMAPPARF
jgi:predicted phosphatase